MPHPAVARLAAPNAQLPHCLKVPRQLMIALDPSSACGSARAARCERWATNGASWICGLGPALLGEDPSLFQESEGVSALGKTSTAAFGDVWCARSRFT